jgi:hypothetical protein
MHQDHSLPQFHLQLFPKRQPVTYAIRIPRRMVKARYFTRPRRAETRVAKLLNVPQKYACRFLLTCGLASEKCRVSG